MAQRAQSVALQLQAPKPPLAFDPAGQAKLSNWKPQRDSGSPFFSNNSSGGQPGRYLGIGASGGLGYGSWRTTVLLQAGDYQFVAKARTQGLELGPGVTRGGITLRMSGERAAHMITDAVSWKTLSYDFKMPALAEVELVCEFRGSSGQVTFDADSLRLVRKQP